MTALAPRTRDDIRDDEAGESFPQHVLAGRESALVLFAAGFLGKQDAYWVAEAGLVATCVDNDKYLLGEMSVLYPAEWRFVLADVFEYTATERRTFDVVTVDCPSGAFHRCGDLVVLWCLRARHTVVLGSGVGSRIVAPDGWRISERRRRSSYDGGVYWTVLERTRDE